MTHSLTPPPELVAQWSTAALGVEDWLGGYNLELIATQAARWGADQELEACCEWIRGWYGSGCGELINELRAARRPKPPSLKEVALEDLRSIELLQKEHKMVACTFNIRRALERLKELEGQ